MHSNAVQAVVAPGFLIMGLSHIVQPQLWMHFFEALRKTRLAAVIIPMYTLPLALVLIVTQNAWVSDWPLFLTIAGWAMALKSAVYLLVPGVADRLLASRMAKTAGSYRVSGAVMALFGGVLTWQAWTGI